MKCPKCQFENPEEMQFCGKCGADGWVEKAEENMAALS
jgi:ribosomal protein L40E